MSRTSTNQRNLVIGLVAIIVLLAAVVGVLLLSNSNKQGQSADGRLPLEQEREIQDASSNMQQQLANAGEFDPANATKLPAGTSPEDWAIAYYEACDKQDWEAAWEHLPKARKDATTTEALGKQLSSYGITGYKITENKETEEGAEVVVDQMTASFGTFTSVWQFVKDGDDWLVKDKRVLGMQ